MADRDPTTTLRVEGEDATGPAFQSVRKSIEGLAQDSKNLIEESLKFSSPQARHELAGLVQTSQKWAKQMAEQFGVTADQLRDWGKQVRGVVLPASKETVQWWQKLGTLFTWRFWRFISGAIFYTALLGAARQLARITAEVSIANQKSQEFAKTWSSMGKYWRGVATAIGDVAIEILSGPETAAAMSEQAAKQAIEVEARRRAIAEGGIPPEWFLSPERLAREYQRPGATFPDWTAPIRMLKDRFVWEKKIGDHRSRMIEEMERTGKVPWEAIYGPDYKLKQVEARLKFFTRTYPVAGMPALRQAIDAHKEMLRVLDEQLQRQTKGSMMYWNIKDAMDKYHTSLVGLTAAEKAYPPQLRAHQRAAEIAEIREDYEAQRKHLAAQIPLLEAARDQLRDFPELAHKYNVELARIEARLRSIRERGFLREFFMIGRFALAQAGIATPAEQASILVSGVSRMGRGGRGGDKQTGVTHRYVVEVDRMTDEAEERLTSRIVTKISETAATGGAF